MLKGLKHPGESFSAVILRHTHPPAETCGELLERLEALPPPEINPDQLRKFRAQRGRRSRRPRR